MVGNFLNLKREYHEKKYLHEALATMAREHDTAVLGLRLGSELTVVVFGYQMAKEVCSRKEFDGRPDTFFIRLRAMGGRGGEFA
jgi:hypothetical protein